MEKEFVPYELAVKLKALGFDEPCFTYYYEDTGKMRTGLSIHIHNGWTYSGTKRLETTLAPTFTQAFRWFREKYGYWSYVKEATKGTCRFYIEKFDEKFFNSDIIDSYEEAELSCIDKLIELTFKSE